MSNAPISGPCAHRELAHRQLAASCASRTRACIGNRSNSPSSHHHPAAAFVLLGRLEDEVRRCRRSRLRCASALRGAEQHRRVAVVAARVHLALVTSTRAARRISRGCAARRGRRAGRPRPPRCRCAARRRRRSRRAPYARRARTSAACPRRTRSSPSPRTRSPDGRGCGGARHACRRASAAISGTRSWELSGHG